MTERTNQTHPGLKIGFFLDVWGDFFVFIQPDINTERNRQLYVKIPLGKQTPNKPSIIPVDSLKGFRGLPEALLEKEKASLAFLINTINNREERQIPDNSATIPESFWFECS